MLVLLALLTACGGGDGAPTAPAGQTPPGAVVNTISVSPSAATLTAIDDTRQLTATARDQSGATMSDQPLGAAMQVWVVRLE